MTAPASSTPPRLPVPGGWHVALTYDVSGQPAVVVLGYGGSGDATSVTNMTNLASTFHSNARALMATSCTLTAITAHAADGTGTSYALALPAANRTGMAAGNLITAYATVIRWGTTHGGRSGKGRTFVPGFVTGNVNADGRTLSSTAITAANTLGNAMAGSTPAAGFSVVSHRLGGVYPVTTYSVPSVVGVQRRRIRN
jgi:hypothetical protein